MVDDPFVPTPLLTPADLRRHAVLRNVNVDKYNDADLQFFIDDAVSFLETETGRIFNSQEKTDIALNQTAIAYLFKYYPVIEITEIKINNNIVNADNYRLDNVNGIIYFEQPFIMDLYGRWISTSSYSTTYDLEISYIAGYDPPLKLAIGLVVDLALDGITKPIIGGGGVIQQKKEKDLAIVYDTSKTSSSDIDNRIRKLKRIRLNII